MLGAEVGAQVHDLPAPEADEQPRGADAEPLDARVGALVGVAQLLLARAQVVHLAHNLGRQLLDPAQVRFDGLELLRRLDGRPVLGVGANVDVELDVAEGRVGAASCIVPLLDYRDAMGGIPVQGRESLDKRTASLNVLKAHVKRRVRVGREDRSRLADDVLGLGVVVAQRVANL